MVNGYILVSGNQRQLTIDGSLEMFGQLLAAFQQIAPSVRNARQSKATEHRLAPTHREPAVNANASSAGHAPAKEEHS